VESLPDSLWLARIGVDCQQGYFFGAPTIQAPWKESPRSRTTLTRHG
jgi:EAL domain-containing protein (putative c-di-GMP-specific phosphodiesterase class I)